MGKLSRCWWNSNIITLCEVHIISLKTVAARVKLYAKSTPNRGAERLTHTAQHASSFHQPLGLEIPRSAEAQDLVDFGCTLRSSCQTSKISFFPSQNDDLAMSFWPLGQWFWSFSCFQPRLKEYKTNESQMYLLELWKGQAVCSPATGGSLREKRKFANYWEAARKNPEVTQVD